MTRVSKPLRIICSLFSILLVLTTVWMFADIASADIGGHVLGNYDFVAESYYWEVDVHKNILGFLTFGTSFGTPTPEIVTKVFVPSGVPTRIDYKLYAEVKIKDFSIRLTDWCNHWLAQSDQSSLDDTWGLDLTVKYEF